MCSYMVIVRCIGHNFLDRTREEDFHFNLLQRTIEIREIILVVSKKDTTDQRYRSLLASRFYLSFISSVD